MQLSRVRRKQRKRFFLKAWKGPWGRSLGILVHLLLNLSVLLVNYCLFLKKVGFNNWVQQSATEKSFFFLKSVRPRAIQSTLYSSALYLHFKNKYKLKWTIFKSTHTERSKEEKTKDILVISPRESNKEQSVKGSYENEAEWLSSISKDYQIRWNGKTDQK